MILKLIYFIQEAPTVFREKVFLFASFFAAVLYWLLRLVWSGLHSNIVLDPFDIARINN